MEQTGKMMLHSFRRFSRVGPLGKSVRVRLQDEKHNGGLAPAGPVLRTKKYVSVETFDVNLYPDYKDPVLKSILEPGSAKRLLNSFNSLQLESVSPKYSTQGIVTLWNMEFMHQAQREFSSSEADELFGPRMYPYSEDPSVSRIVSHIVSHAAKLNDKPLAASLYCMWRLKFDVRGEDCQTLVNELLKRRSRLTLPALARLCVVLRKESLYGNLVLAEFGPLLHSYIRRMSSDQDVHLVSMAIRGAHAVTTNQASDDYVKRLKQFFDDRRIKRKPATLCSVLNYLSERQPTIIPGKVLTQMGAEVLRRAGNMLVPHVQSMEVLDIVSILKVLEFQQEPAPLIDALTQRLSKIIEESKENVSVHLMVRTRPWSVDEQVKLEDFLRRKLQGLVPPCPMFPVLSRILQKSLYPCYDHKVFNRFWSLCEQNLGSVLAENNARNLSGWPANEDDEQEDIKYSSTGPLASFVKTVVTYMYLCSPMNRSYRHLKFEATASRIVLEILASYEDGKCVITTQEYATCVAFLIATGHPNVTIKPSFLQQFRVRHFMLLNVATVLGGGQGHEIGTILEQQCPKILKGRLGPMEYLTLAKITLPSQAAFRQSVRTIEVLPWSNAHFAAEFLQLLRMFVFYSERSFQRVSKFICEAGNDLSWDCATEFLGASYVCGAERLDDAVQIAARVVEKNLWKADPLATIRSMNALCYHGHLSKHFVRKVFSEEYRRHIDKYITAKPLGSKAAVALRDTFVELNRAVCIGMPEAGIHWFHGKYCQGKARKEGPPKWSSEHFLVHRALFNVIGPFCLTKDTYSPYFHVIDFLVHIDGKGNPVPTICKDQAVGKLAIIVHHMYSYTVGNERRLKGFRKLERRELEALGYRVIEIDPLDWHRLRSSKNRAEEDYLRECIFQ